MGTLMGSLLGLVENSTTTVISLIEKKFWNNIHIQKFDTMIFLKTTSCRRNIATKWKELTQFFSFMTHSAFRCSTYVTSF